MEKQIALIMTGHSQYDDDVWDICSKVTRSFVGEFNGHVGMDMASFVHLMALAGATVEPLFFEGDVDGLRVVVLEEDYDKFLCLFKQRVKSYIINRFPNTGFTLDI